MGRVVRQIFVFEFLLGSPQRLELNFVHLLVSVDHLLPAELPHRLRVRLFFAPTIHKEYLHEVPKVQVRRMNVNRLLESSLTHSKDIIECLVALL